MPSEADAGRDPSARQGAADELDTKILRSSAWAAMGFGGTNLLSLVTTIVLGRLLVPNDFGLVALALAVLAVANLAQESGLGAALVVHRGNLRVAAASATVFSPLVAVALYVVAFVSAPTFASIFDAPRLSTVLRVLGLMLLVRGFAVMPRAILTRGMHFRAIAAVELSGGIAQAAAAITAAALGAGVWSLVAGQLALAVVQTALSWAFCPLRPSPFEAQRSTLRELVRYGRFVGAANILNYANSSTEGIVVGRVLGTASLGQYTIGSRLAGLPVQVIGIVLGRGVFAALARVQDDLDAFRRVWLENVQRIALFAIPATIGVLAVADPLVLTLLGEKWRPAIEPLQVLALNGLFRPVTVTSGEVFQALNRPHYRVAIEVSYLALLVPGLIAGAHWFDLGGAAAAVVLVNLITGIPVVVVMMRLMHVPLRQFAETFARPAIGWAALAATLLVLLRVLDGQRPAVQLAALVTAGAAVYAAAVALFARAIVVRMWLNLRGARASR